MARDQVDLTPIERRDELVDWLAQGCKPKSQFRIGTEHEKFAFTLEGHRPVPYEGRRGIRALLEGMQHLLGWQPIMEGPNVIGLFDVTGGTISYIDGMGTKAFVALCNKLAKLHGDRFKPCKLLLDMAKKGETFYGRFPPQARQAAA